MRKIISIIMALFIMLVPFVGCSDAPASNTPKDDKYLTLNKTSVTLSTFGEADIIASYQDIDDLTWTNNNSQVISMTEHGNYVKVTAIKAGISSVTVSGGGKSATCAVIVNESSDVLSVEIDRLGDLEVSVNGTLYVPAVATFRGETLEDASILYAVKDTAIATVTTDGVVTGVKGGQTTLTVQAEYKGVRSSVKEINLTVKDGPALVLSSTYFNIYEKDASVIEKFYPYRQNFSFYLVDGENKVTDFTSTVTATEDSVAKFENGKIVALSAGSTIFTVTVTYNDTEYVAYLYVTVNKVPTVEIKLSDEKLTLYANIDITGFQTSKALSATVFVDGKIESTDVKWKVEEGIGSATVNSRGTVTAQSAGKASVVATYTYNGSEYKSTCAVKVVERFRYSELKADVNKDGNIDIDTNILYADLISSSNKIQINDVSLTDSHDKDLIRFGVPNYGEYAPQIFRLFFRMTDVNDPTNWIEFIVGYYANGAPGAIISYAMNTSTWDLGTMIGLGVNNKGTLMPMQQIGGRSDSNYNNPSGVHNSGTGMKWFNDHTQTDYTNNMLGFSLVDDEIHFNYKSSSDKWARVSLAVFTKAQQAELLASGTTYANPVWNGFSSKGVTKVNITISAQLLEANKVAPLMIDTLSGNPTSVSDVAKLSVASN